MLRAAARPHHLLLLLFLHLLESGLLQEVEEEPVEVITESSPCSATCGLGIRTQTLCVLEDSEAARQEQKGSREEAKVTEACRVRKVNCVESWQCGLRTMTVTSGQRVEVDCVGEVMEALGRFSWRVSWRYARGVVSSDDSLFARFKAPQLDRVVLDPVQEEDAGTYRCDVQDAAFRRVKRVYWGIRVLPVEVLDLDYESSLSRWDQTPEPPTQEAPRLHFLHMVMISLSAAAVLTGLVFLCVLVKRTRGHIFCPSGLYSSTRCRNSSAPL